MNIRILAIILTIASIIVGVLHLVLYFYEIIPGQIPSGAPFYLRMGLVFILGVPLFVQILARFPPSEHPKAVSYLALFAVLALAIVLMMLLLPSMLVGSSWGIIDLPIKH